jgi:hypothetical protein
MEYVAPDPEKAKVGVVDYDWSACDACTNATLPNHGGRRCPDKLCEELEGHDGDKFVYCENFREKKDESPGA